MNIDKENIDEILFDYFEGQLTPTQSDTLMAYIHQHPEYEKDFMQWKKAYHHKDHEIEDYGIAQAIKVPEPILLKFKPYFMGGLYMLGLGLGMLTSWSAGGLRSEKNIVAEQTTLPNVAQSPKQQAENAVTNKNSFKPSKTIVVLDNEPKEIEQLPQPEQTPLTNENNVEPIPTSKIETTEIAEELTQTLELKDSSNTITQPEEIAGKSEKNVLEKKKIKKRKSGMYSTTDKFLPINQNF